MGIINMIKTIKQIHQYDIILIKIGEFYHVYGKDSYIISYLLRYRIKEIEGISMCGFPNSSINKVVARLEEHKINYLKVNRKNNYEVDEISDNKNLNNYIKYFEKAKKFVNNKKRIDDIYNFMIKNIDKEDFKNTIQKMEDVINERRKVSSN